MEKLSAVLHEARVGKGLSLRDIEKLSDGEISNAYICQIEKGVVPYPEKLRVLSRILKLNFLELMILAGHVTKSDLTTRGA